MKGTGELRSLPIAINRVHVQHSRDLSPWVGAAILLRPPFHIAPFGYPNEIYKIRDYKCQNTRRLHAYVPVMHSVCHSIEMYANRTHFKAFSIPLCMRNGWMENALPIGLLRNRTD